MSCCRAVENLVEKLEKLACIVGGFSVVYLSPPTGRANAGYSFRRFT